jgi:Ankyrin repeat
MVDVPARRKDGLSSKWCFRTRLDARRRMELADSRRSAVRGREMQERTSSSSRARQILNVTLGVLSVLIALGFVFVVIRSCRLERETTLVDQTPPLYHMIVRGDSIAKIKAKISKDPGVVGQRGADGQTNLYYAVDEKRIDAVRLLLKKGEDPNVFSFESPLANAVGSEDVAIIELLLNAGADPNEPSGSIRLTPYQLAKQSNNKVIIELFDSAMKMKRD